MSAAIQRPDPDRVMAGLKDFQRRTVDHAFARMYLDPQPARRFLVADEVGLGKTLIARGLIAKALDHLWDKVGRLDVIYICSNADIARQNVARLNVLGETHVSMASRLTMLPETLKGLRSNKVNFVSFTPGTSFDLKTATGQYQERVLLYRMLREAWNLGSARPPMNVLQADMGWQRFRREVELASTKDIDPDLHRAFCDRLAQEAERQARDGKKTLRERFDLLCGVFARGDSNPPREHRVERSRLISDLRRLLARTCIHKLEPDLIILDEFQRFKNLLGGDDEAALLAQGLFDYEDADSRARVLLLSATPYKMYTTPGGASDEDHYVDFLATLAFLQNDAVRTAKVQRALDEYRRLLLSLGAETRSRLAEVKAELEDLLRRVMTRTERLAVSEKRNGMLEERTRTVDGPRVRSIRNYQTMQRIARELEHPDTVEYWKAAPYLLNFMIGYKLKDDFADRVEGDGLSIAPLLRADEHVVAPAGILRGKEPLDPPHARLRWLVDDTVGRGLWKLLWMPPSFPYYELGEPFASLAAQNVTKRLVFSAWRVVPRTIAALLSYEAERRMLESVSAEHPSLDVAREKVSEPLKFSRSEGRLTGMSALGILYPSFTLASLADPLDPYYRRSGGRTPSRDELLTAVRARLAPRLDALVRARGQATGPADESWYWAAPILLDQAENQDLTERWLTRRDAARQWILGAEADDEGADEYRSWAEHVRNAADVAMSSKPLGRAPDDLLDVVSRMALAGPGVAALRSVSRVTGGEPAQRLDYVRDAAGAIAWSLRNLFNLPDSTALLRGLYPEVPYWLAVVEYCAAGGLQAVLDEYQHVLPEFVGLVSDGPELIASRVAEEVRTALSLRTAAVPTDEVRVTSEARVELSRKRMRSRFAVRFGDTEQDDEGDERTRKGQLRSAFNSPFWPFVLATTSVGQEGLDFHQYCHAVVHWNLPSNPVDLEQREGRVHRFKGHAVRKNVARRYGDTLLQRVEGGDDDPWLELFEMARDGRPAGSSDIFPYWVFPLEGGAAVERHVPNLPLSRDVEQLMALRRTLAVYRMVFGQPRQDELLDYLLSQKGGEGAIEHLDAVRIDLEPV